MCVLVGVTMLFMSPFAGLIDTITLEYTSEHAIPYGPIRVMGTIGFGVISLISGFFGGNNIDVIFYIYVGMAILCALVLLGCPRVEGHARAGDGSKPARLDLRPLLRAHRLWIIVGFMLLCQFAYKFYGSRGNCRFPGDCRSCGAGGISGSTEESCKITL